LAIESCGFELFRSNETDTGRGIIAVNPLEAGGVALKLVESGLVAIKMIDVFDPMSQTFVQRFLQ